MASDKLLSADSSAAKLAASVPRTPNTKYAYGTAGFRTKADTLKSTVLRMGMLAAVRARTVGTISSDSKESKAVGIVITASHNLEHDNGLKLVDSDGGMLASSWESHCTAVANADEKEVCQELNKIASNVNANWSITPKVFVGCDTRKSSAELKSLVCQGVEALGGIVVDFGLVTTPQVHYAVREYNAGRPSELKNYYDNLSSAFVTLLGDDAKSVEPLTVDCANGVGSVSLEQFASRLDKVLPLTLINKSGSGPLNQGAGAEHVQKARKLPTNVDASQKGVKFASVDGDADRVVYYTVDAAGQLQLMDGDKIISLIASYIIDLMKVAKLDLNLGVVQTAYANGASTIYISKTLGVSVDCVKTGVKHLHHKAVDLDIGVYFEANGHGTVVFSDAAVKAFQTAAASSDASIKAAGADLVQLPLLVNQAIGDAVSDLLLVEVILAKRGWSLSKWSELYDDLPSKMTKVKVKDRTVVKTTDAERKCVNPPGLQPDIDAIVSSVGGNARCFVRPSGTEDVVRVYAEADKPDDVDKIVFQVEAAVAKHCN